MKKTKKAQAIYYQKHRLSRYIALAIFASLPFIGFLLGYYLS